MKGLMIVEVITCVTSLLVVLVSPAAVRPSREEFIQQTKLRCNQNYRLYYDHGTENCEQCREICDHAAIMGTEQQCQDYCPQYQEAMKCVEAEDKFYDENVGECSHCSVICTNHKYKGTTEDCEDKCSVYLAKQTPKQVPSYLEENSLRAEQTEGGADSSSPLLHPGWIAAIVIGSIALICTTLIAIALVRTCSSQYAPAPQDENTTPRKPVEETIRQGDSAHFAIDGVGNPARASQAFSDLPVDGSRSDSRRPVLS